MIGKHLLKHAPIPHYYKGLTTLIAPQGPQCWVSVSTVVSFYLNDVGSGFFRLVAATTGVESIFYCPIEFIPEGATITEIGLRAYTIADATSYVELELFRSAHASTSIQSMASLQHINIGGTTVISTTTITNPILDLDTYYYFFELRLWPDANATDAQYYASYLKWRI